MQHLHSGWVTCVLLQRADLTNPCEDSQAWKTYSYLDEEAARGREWDNRKEYNVLWHCIGSDSNTITFTEGNQIWQSCVKILICLERISAPHFCKKKKKWKWMLTAACHCFIFWTSDLNRETSLRKGREKPRLKDSFWSIVKVITQSRFAIFLVWLLCDFGSL